MAEIQAKLPDVNAILVYYRTLAQRMMREKNYNGAASALNNQNAVLPEDYQVIVDTPAYNESVQNGVFYKCSHCNQEVLSKDVRLFEMKNSSWDTLVQGVAKSSYWHCPRETCGRLNRFNADKVIKERMQEPYFLKTVWSCPLKKTGLTTRFGYNKKFEDWFYTYQKEIEHQIGRYRTDYNPEGTFEGEENSEMGYDETGEE